LRLLSAVVLASGLAGVTAFTIAASADEIASKAITCEEKIPPGSTRPTITEKFPGTATASYEAVLELSIKHGKGETPLPSGFKITAGSDVDKNLLEAGFLPGEPDAGGTSSLRTEVSGTEATTTVEILFVVAPLKSGTRSLTLPRIPVTISRANGERMIICTQLHSLVASDPTADEKDPAAPKPRPAPSVRGLAAHQAAAHRRLDPDRRAFAPCVVGTPPNEEARARPRSRPPPRGRKRWSSSTSSSSRRSRRRARAPGLGRRGGQDRAR
jgi:hypothetical protein